MSKEGMTLEEIENNLNNYLHVFWNQVREDKSFGKCFPHGRSKEAMTHVKWREFAEEM
jgi:truncated hemoglobin YjbI